MAAACHMSITFLQKWNQVRSAQICQSNFRVYISNWLWTKVTFLIKNANTMRREPIMITIDCECDNLKECKFVFKMNLIFIENKHPRNLICSSKCLPHDYCVNTHGQSGGGGGGGGGGGMDLTEYCSRKDQLHGQLWEDASVFI